MTGKRTISAKSLYSKGMLVSFVLAGMTILILNSVRADASLIGEEFRVSQTIQPGLVVSLSDDSDVLQLARTDIRPTSIGVTVAAGDSAVVYSKDFSNTEVAFAGDVLMYVSDRNGLVTAGDVIVLSSVAGVGARSTGSANELIIGIALENFNTEEAVPYGTVSDEQGDSDTSIDSVSVRLLDDNHVAPVQAQTNALQRLLNGVAGREVSPAQALIAALMFTASVGVAGVFVSSSIKHSFTSLGRNPLASKVIFKSLFSVVGLSIIVVAIGSVMSYLVLKVGA